MTAKVDTGDLGPSSGATGANQVPEGAASAGRVDEESKLIGAVGSAAANADDVMNLGTSPNDAPSPSNASSKPASAHTTSNCFAQVDFQSGE